MVLFILWRRAYLRGHDSQTEERSQQTWLNVTWIKLRRSPSCANISAWVSQTNFHLQLQLFNNEMNKSHDPTLLNNIIRPCLLFSLFWRRDLQRQKWGSECRTSTCSGLVVQCGCNTIFALVKVLNTPAIEKLDSIVSFTIHARSVALYLLFWDCKHSENTQILMRAVEGTTRSH